MILPSDVLRRDGWCQGTGTDRAGRHCAGGAIGGAFSISEVDAFAAFHTAAVKEQPFLSRWNDTPGRTKEEVITLLEKVEYKLGLRVADGPRKPTPMPEDPIPWAAQMKEVVHVA